MKKKILLICLSLALSFTLLSFGDADSKYQGGSPGGYAGAPPVNKTCKNCHGGQIANVTGWITSNVPASGYSPGTAYTITLTASGTGKKGFEVTPRSLSGLLLGALTPGAGNKLVDSLRAITQSSSVNTSPATWNFTWTAPPAGTGTVTFYGAFTVGLQNTKLCTLEIPESTAGIDEITHENFSVYPNPVIDIFHITSNLKMAATYTIFIYNLTGDLLFVKNEQLAAGKNIKSYSLPAPIKKGSCILKISGKDEIFHKKIIFL